MSPVMLQTKYTFHIVTMDQGRLWQRQKEEDEGLEVKLPVDALKQVMSLCNVHEVRILKKAGDCRQAPCQPGAVGAWGYAH